MDKKKAGIITFHDADNLGAVLQAYALKTTLEDRCGISAQVIDYKCIKITETKYPAKAKGLKGLIKSVPMHIYYTIKRRGFESFRKAMLDCTEKYTKSTVKNCEKNFDFFISGSDQVWNPECSGGDTSYLLDFVSDNEKKYSYAASLGNYEISSADSEWLEHIKCFKIISVREKTSAEQLCKNGADRVSVNCDPVFLLSESQWQSVMNKRIVSSPYVLVYSVLPDAGLLNRAKEYARKNNCKVISNKKSIEFILHNSPQDFLSWIYYADCVFTNSFHGTAFSLIFKKKLYSDIRMTNGKINSRVNDLLEAAGVFECSKDVFDICIKKDSAEISIDNMRKAAFEYLESIGG